VTTYNADLASFIGDSGPYSGLPEEIWKTFADKAAEPNAEGAIAAWSEMRSGLQALLAKP
jgi:hypothetical protein